MDDLWQAVAEIALELSPDRVESGAAAMERVAGPEDFGGARTFGPNLPTALWLRFQDQWKAHPDVSPQTVAAALRAASRARQIAGNAQTLNLVWTGPKTGLVPVRTTEQVMLEVIQSATHRLFLVSFVNFGAKAIVDALNEASTRGVSVRMLLEDSKGALKRLKAAVPSATFYVWSEEAKEESGSPLDACVHAKCVVADDTEAFITSANLTDRALEKNMELGVQIKRGREPRLLMEHLNALVVTRKVQRVD